MATLDWVVIGLYAVGMLAVGSYFSRRVKTSEDYMLGGRRMRPWAVGLSLFATLLSAISYLASPGEIIKYGPMLLVCGVSAYPVIFLIVGWLLIPSIMKMKVSSAYELLEIRLGLSVRMLASVLFLVIRLVWMAVIIYMCAVKVIIPIMGWSQNAAIWVSIAMGIITVIYTSMGGLRAVVLTDVTQTFILFAAAVISIILICKELGSPVAWVPEKVPETWLAWKFFDPQARLSFLTVFISTSTWYICTCSKRSTTSSLLIFPAATTGRWTSKRHLPPSGWKILSNTVA